MIPRTRAFAALGVLALAASGTVVAVRRTIPNDRVLPGLRVEGFELPDDVARGDDARIAAWIERRIDAVLARSVDLRAGKAVRTVTLKDLVGRPDALSLARTLRRLGHEGSLGVRLDLALRARRGAIDVPIALRADPVAIERLAAGLKFEVDVLPSDAKLDLAAHTVVPDREGQFLDVDGAVALAEVELLRQAHDALRFDPSAAPPIEPLAGVELPIARAPARLTAASLAKLDISTVVGRFETHFGRGGDQAPRAINIEVAGKKLDGLVIEPGQLVSFNAVVGERSEANGFKVAWEIFKGEMRPGVGGGTCQVASTFHAAAFFAGLDILERLPHSRPSAYITMGLDSTVVYPVVDLKVKNPHPFPVVVHTKVGANKIEIELLGREKPVSVVFARDVVDTFPYVRKIEEEPWVKPGKAIKKQGGIRGYRVRRTRTLTYGNGVTRTESSYDFYPPTTEIYVVAPGTDPNDLPPLPEDVQEMLAKKNGEPLPSPTKSDAVACAGDCEGETKPAIEIANGAGVHAPTGDQATPLKSVSIKH